jgi:hypothetical protein
VIALSWSLIRGAHITEPCETSGLAPTISSSSVRSRSGIGSRNGDPYSSELAAKRFETSWEEAVY